MKCRTHDQHSRSRRAVRSVSLGAAVATLAALVLPLAPAAADAPDPAASVTSITLTPAAQVGYDGALVTIEAVFRDADGAPVSGAEPIAAIVSGPSAGSSITRRSDSPGQPQSTTSNAAGLLRLSYVAHADSGTDTARVWFDRDVPGNTPGQPDPGEPQATATVTLRPYDLQGYTITSNAPVQGGPGIPDTMPVATGTTTVTVTFTVTGPDAGPAAGMTVHFGKVLDTGPEYVFSAASAVTDAAGHASLTITAAGSELGRYTTVRAYLPLEPGGDMNQTPNLLVAFAWQQADGYTPVTPTRLVDTRSGLGGVRVGDKGALPLNGLLWPGTRSWFMLDEDGPVPPAQSAYAFNVTVSGVTAPGNLQIAPGCLPGEPQTSIVNYQPGKDVANFVIVSNPGNCNGFNLYTNGSTVAVMIDVLGYYSAAGIRNVAPVRLADTREQGGPIAAGTSRTFQITGATVPSGATAVALNLTAIHPAGYGNLRVYPHGSAVPNASSANYLPGVDKAAFVVVRLPADGKIDVYSDGSAADLAIDVYEYFDATTIGLITQDPQRVLDTRHPPLTLGAGHPLTITLAGKGNVPPDARAVLATVTAVHTYGSTGVGHLRVYPAGVDLPTVSTINYVSPLADIANFVIVPLGAGGQITLYSSGSPTDVTVDVVGWVPAGAGDTA